MQDIKTQVPIEPKEIITQNNKHKYAIKKLNREMLDPRISKHSNIGSYSSLIIILN